MSMLSFNSLVCWQITLTLLHVSWIGLVIGLIVALANRVLRNSRASRRYWLNFASLLMMALSLPVTLEVVRSVTAEAPSAVVVEEAPLVEVADLAPRILDESNSFSPPVDASEFAPIQPQESSDVAEIAATFRTPTPVAATPSAWESASSIAHTAAPFVAILYAIGVALMFAKLAYGVRVSRRLLSASQAVTDAKILARLAEQAKKLSLRVTPVIAFCDHIGVPIVVGLLRPMILIPAAMVNGLTIEQLESVLTHELAHLRRRDHLMIVVQRVLEAILFFHPVTWYLSHRLHDDRETSCDDLVLSIGGDRLQYAQSLLRVAELRLAGQLQQKHIALAADGQRPSKLRLRIARLLGDTEGDSVRMGSIWPVATVLLFLLSAIASLSSSIRPAFATVQEDVKLDYEAVLKLANKAYENPAPITTAHVRFRIAELREGFHEGMTSEKCRQLLSGSGLVSQPDKLKDLLGSLIKGPNQLDANPWTRVDLYQGEPGIRTTTSTATNGPDYWIGEQWSYRWDSTKSQASLLRREDDRFHNDERLDEFLRNRRMTFADLKFQKPISIRKDGDKILLHYDRNSELKQETTLDAVTGRIHSVANSSHGVVIQERLQLGWRAFNDDIWLPTIIAELRYRRGDLDHCRFIVIEDASFNQPLPDDVFRFGVPAGSVISDKRVGLNQTYTINRDVADVTSDEQLAAARTPLNEQSDEEGIARITDTVSLKLSGVVSLPSTQKQSAWLPNGTEIEPPSAWPEPIRVASQEPPTHGFIFECTGLQDGQAIAWRTSDTEGMSKAGVVPSLSELIPVRIGITGSFADQKKITLRAGITTADWGPWRSIKTDDSLEEVTPAAPFAELYRRVKPDAYSSDREVGLVLEGIQGIDDRAQHEVVAVMKNGEQQQRSGSGYENGKGVITFFRLSSDDVDHLEYRLRPYIHWVTFENVSLQSSEKTDVRISVKSLPKPQSIQVHAKDNGF